MNIIYRARQISERRSSRYVLFKKVSRPSTNQYQPRGQMVGAWKIKGSYQMHRSPFVARYVPEHKLAINKSKKSSDEFADFGLMPKHAGKASEFLKALAHESRLLILCLLCEGEKTVTDLEELLSLRQASVSQHLARLRLDGLVRAKRNGKAIHYSLANDDVRAILGALNDVFCKRSKRRAR